MEHNIKMYPNEIGYKSMDWIRLAQDKPKWQVLGKKIMECGEFHE